MSDRADRGRGGQQVGRVAPEECGNEAQRAAMGDDDAVFASSDQLDDGVFDAGDQVGAGFAAGWCKAERVGGPGVECGAGDGVPREAFPGAEVEFLEAWLDDRSRHQGLGENEAAAGRAGDDFSDAGGGEGRAHRDERGVTGGAEADVEAAVAMARRDVGRGMAHQDELHDAA